MRSADIAVIVVNYCTAALTVAAVKSVLAKSDARRPLEVHVVDNASPGRDAEILRSVHAAEGWDARVTLWCEDRNHGFGRANNLVIQALSNRTEPPAYVFLLNPDAWLENDVVTTLIAALDAVPDAGAAGAALTGPDGQHQSAAFRFPSFGGELLRTINFGPLDALFGNPGRALPPQDGTVTVDWVSGSAVIFRMEALREVGGFDPNFFLYFEEVELMHRLAQAGWTTLHVPAAHVGHAEGAATGGGGRRADQPGYVYDSWRHYFRLTMGRARALALALAMFPAAGLNVLLSRLRGRSPSVPNRFFREHWVRVVCPLVLGRDT